MSDATPILDRVQHGGLLGLNHSIVAMNTGSSAPDIAGSITGNFKFIGLTDGDPMLGPLQDNRRLRPAHAANSQGSQI